MLRIPLPLRSIGSIALAAVCTITLVTCTKDAPEINPALPHGAKAQVTPRIKAFIERAGAERAGGRKSGNTISPDSAIWYIEAALNFALTNTQVNYNNATDDSTALACTMNVDGTVDESEVLAAYNTAFDALENIPTNEQHLVVIDASGSAQGTQLAIVCSYVIGSGYEQSLNTTYTNEDDYLWWQGFGQSSGCPCGDNPNTISWCADHHIQKRINYEITGGVLGYWTDVETWSATQFPTDVSANNVWLEDLPNPDPNLSGHSNQDYLIYLCGGMDCVTCLDEGDMAFHTQGTYDAMLKIRNDYCPTKELVTCRMDGDTDGTSYFHTARFSYGLRRR